MKRPGSMDLNKKSTLEKFIKKLINTSRFAILATEGDGQPHASLIAITPYENFRQIIFATYRNTIKYRNLANNNKVALLIESSYVNTNGLSESCVITIIGHTEVIIEDRESALQVHLKRHPDMESFILSPDCALIRVRGHSYQVVSGIDDIKWIKAEDLDAI